MALTYDELIKKISYCIDDGYIKDIYVASSILAALTGEDEETTFRDLKRHRQIDD